MDLGSVLGMIAGITFILVGIALPEFDFGKTMSFVDGPSVMMTVGGTIAAMFVAYPPSKLLVAVKAAKFAFMPVKINPSEAIQRIITLANLARKEGILALEDAASSMEDEFLKKGVMLIVDGTDPELVRSILETEMVYIEGRHGEVRSVWDYMASAAPAWGMVGTLIGLVLMLQNMADPSAIGPTMSVTIITTFYGSLMANLIATPLATKLKIYSSQELLMKEVLIEGILSIQAGENPRIIEEKLKAFLSPSMRSALTDGDDKGGDE